MSNVYSDHKDRCFVGVMIGIGMVSSVILIAGVSVALSPFEGLPAGASAALPVFAAVCVALVISVAWMIVYVRTMGRRLDHLHKLASTDQLTGLANRMALLELQSSARMQAALRTGKLAAISLDLDEFKQLNDTYGHHVGDQVLRAAASRLKKAVPNADQVFRMGGDEFLCLISGDNPCQVAEKVVTDVMASFEAPIDLGNTCVKATPSVGFAVAEPNAEWDQMMQRSDAAMYRTKRERQSEVRKSPLQGELRSLAKAG